MCGSAFAPGVPGKVEIQAESPVCFRIRQSLPNSETIVHIGRIISPRGLSPHATSHRGRRKEKPEAYGRSLMRTLRTTACDCQVYKRI